MENEVVLLQPLLGGIRLDECGSGALQLLLRNASGETLKVGVGSPAAGELRQRVPAAREWQLENQADYAVVVVLDVSFEALTALKDQGLQGLFHRRALVADVSGGLVLETGRGRTGAEDIAQIVQAKT